MLPLIPQSDPGAAYRSRKVEIDEAIHGVLHSGRYILGEEVSRFEVEFAAHLGTSAAIGVGNGTDALSIALRAVGVEPGNFVATVSHTAVATVAAIEMAGARPVLIEIDPRTMTMDPDALAVAMEKLPIKAVLPVHLYGRPADMNSIGEIARRHGALVVEDCAQSHGKFTGALGNAAAFSFYPTKNLGALGDGGCIATSDASVAERCKMLREYGWQERVSQIAGVNSRLDELQAAVLRVKLRYLDEANQRRAAIAAAYRNLLADVVDVVPPTDVPDHVYHQFVIRTPRRDALRQYMADCGVSTLIHYPVPVHMQPAYAGRLAMVGTLAATESAANEVLSLPMYPELTNEAVSRVADAVRAFYLR